MGLLDAGPGSLGGLADARKRHLSQFFTPDAVAAFMWQFAMQAMPDADAARAAGGAKYSILDNSVGSGRLLQFCDPAVHVVGGLDVHKPSIEQVQSVFESAGFDCVFDVGSLAGARPSGWSVCMMNPPFSIQLESPVLKSYPTNSFGRHGPRTSARSDVYALQQALDAADVVVALLPRTLTTWLIALRSDKDWSESRLAQRLRGVFDLPTGSFESEGASVEVGVAVFGSADSKPAALVVEKVVDLSKAPTLGIRASRSAGFAKINWREVADEGPSIHLPVTGDKRVRLVHDGRKLGLRFKCGLAQAKAMNAVLVQTNYTSDEARLPKQYKFSGSSRLDLEAHIASGDALESLNRLIADIKAEGLEVEVASGLVRHLVNRERRSKRQATPFAHVVYDDLASKQGGKMTAVARASVVTDPSSWFGWVIPKGGVVEFKKDGSDFVATNSKGQQCRLNADQLRLQFDCTGVEQQAAWREVHAGMLKSYPVEAARLRKRVSDLGIDKWLTWDYQIDDLIELAMKPQGACCAWGMGLGKTRLAVALILLTGVKRAIIAMDSYLVPEFAGKLKDLPIDPMEWQIIDSPEKTVDLKRINLIAYERVRMPMTKGSTKTYARALRRRASLVIADEGEILANPSSDQSKALWMLAAKRRIVLSGTPISNYPRDLHAVVTFNGGDGTSAQPFGWRGPYMEQRLATSALYAERGVDRFRDQFIVTEWVTNEFKEDNRGGAKREVPKITNLGGYREMMSPHVKRRVTAEPAVQKHVQIPEAKHMAPHVVEFDDRHLGHYLRVADEFAEWWMNQRESQIASKAPNLMLTLVRVGAVVRANNCPQLEKSGEFGWSGLTSKQQFTIDRLETLVNGGDKVIMLCHNPLNVEIFHKQMLARGIDSVQFHGKIPIARRYADMKKNFRAGGKQLLLATMDVTKAGMDLPEATRVVYYDRDWTHKAEAQSLCRALRPQTKHEVTAEYVHLRGSLDEYQAQMVAFKRDCFSAGLDWAAPEFAQEDFLHMNTIIERFVQGLADLRQQTRTQLRDDLKRLAA